MEIMNPIVFASFVDTTLNIVWAALGLGLVIFFHELGHFAVAKWCNVNVERFSIGFGPILWSKKKGETEYALSAIPFGGYVKMLGQDDMDPSQLSSDEIAQDPRSYSAKNVPQRMAIISAGVIMNIVTGMLFFAGAFGIGVKTNAPTIGFVRTGGRAWQAGHMPGDKVQWINDRKIESFNDIQRGVALTSGDLTTRGVDRTGKAFEPRTIVPDGRGTRRKIGVGPSPNLTIINPPAGTGISIVAAGTPAAKADPPFQPGDTIVELDNEAVDNYATLLWLLARKRAAEKVTFTLKRPGGETVKTDVGRNPFRTLGLTMDIGEIAAIRNGSPAERAGLQPGDKITHVEGQAIGGALNPLKLPDEFERLRREGKTSIEIEVRRRDEGKDQAPAKIVIEFRDTDPEIPAWLEVPQLPNTPLSIPSIGVAFHMIPTIVAVEEGSPAAEAKLKALERIEKMEFVLDEGATPDDYKDNPISIEFGKKDQKTGEELKNWAYAFWLMQMTPTRSVRLSVVNTKGESRTVELTPRDSQDWFIPTRGFRTEMMAVELKANGVVESLQFGAKRAKDSVLDVYLTLTRLFDRRISPKELSGPVGIAKFAYQAVEQGLPSFLLFLGFLSINLAVLNFLPIPVLDGGHMVFLLWEAVTRKKPSERVMIAATYIGLAFVLSLMAFVLYLDLFVKK